MNKKLEISLPMYDDLFSTQEQRDDMKKEKIEMIELSKLQSFENHPFKVIENDELLKLIESIKENGVIYPAIARPKGDYYELIAGHRRKAACEFLGYEIMQVLIRDLTDEQAIIAMVDSDFHRENILPSEKAFAYKMKYEALSHQGKTTSCQLGAKLRTSEILAQKTNESGRQIQRYIRLTELIPPLLQMVDDKSIAFNPAVELSYLNADEQSILLDTIRSEQCTPSLSQAQRLKKLSQENCLNIDAIFKILTEEKPNQKEQYKFQKEDIRKYFPKSYSDKQVYDEVFKALELLKQKRERSRDAR